MTSNANMRRVKRRKGARHNQFVRPFENQRPHRQRFVGASDKQWERIVNDPRISAVAHAFDESGAR